MDWEDKNQETLKPNLFPLSLLHQDGRKDPDLSKHPDLPDCPMYNLDPFVLSETLPVNFSLVEDGSEPHDVVS